MHTLRMGSETTFYAKSVSTKGKQRESKSHLSTFCNSSFQREGCNHSDNTSWRSYSNKVGTCEEYGD